jgi:hypothetical protein
VANSAPRLLEPWRSRTLMPAGTFHEFLSAFVYGTRLCAGPIGAGIALPPSTLSTHTVAAACIVASHKMAAIDAAPPLGNTRIESLRSLYVEPIGGEARRS